MKKKLKILYILLVSLSLIGCKFVTSVENKNTEINIEKISNEEYLKADIEIINEYEKLIKEQSSYKELYDFVQIKISQISKLNADKMIEELIEACILENYKLGEKKRVTNEETVLLCEHNDLGNYICSKIEYEKLYNDYKDYLSKDYSAYLKLKSIDLNQSIESDQAIITTWDELGDRIHLFEEYLELYPISEYYNQIKDRYNYYISSYVYGFNNTPVYNYSDGKILEVVEKSYRNYIEKYPTGKLTEILIEYLNILEKNEYIIENKNVTEYIIGISEELQNENRH